MAEAGQTVAIRLKLANNNPDIVSRIAVYEAGKYTPLQVDSQVSYRVVDPTQKSKIAHLIVLTLPSDRGSGRLAYEIEPLFDYDGSPQFGLDDMADGGDSNGFPRDAARGSGATGSSRLRNCEPIARSHLN